MKWLADFVQVQLIVSLSHLFADGKGRRTIRPKNIEKSSVSASDNNL